MNTPHRNHDEARDPLGLSSLADPAPEAGGMAQDWLVVSDALEKRRKRQRAWWGGLAAAASVVLVIALLAIQPTRSPPPIEQQAATTSRPESAVAQPSAGDRKPSTADLIAMSQDMERQLRFLSAQVGSMPSEVVVYQVELQDLISQVDDVLSMAPDSQALWGQRLQLQMSLVRLYRGQLRRDYGRVASL